MCSSGFLMIAHRWTFDANSEMFDAGPPYHAFMIFETFKVSSILFPQCLTRKHTIPRISRSGFTTVILSFISNFLYSLNNWKRTVSLCSSVYFTRHLNIADIEGEVLLWNVNAFIVVHFLADPTWQFTEAITRIWTRSYDQICFFENFWYSRFLQSLSCGVARFWYRYIAECNRIQRQVLTDVYRRILHSSSACIFFPCSLQHTAFVAQCIVSVFYPFRKTCFHSIHKSTYTTELVCTALTFASL